MCICERVNLIIALYYVGIIAIIIELQGTYLTGFGGIAEVAGALLFCNRLM